MIQFEGRFTDCDDSQFPEITNYNFRENKLYRGSDDRDFRWEDVSIHAIYQFRELTVSGSFENNRYTTYHAITNNTGTNYITNLTTVVDHTGFPGWTVTGGYTLWIGQSGARYTSGTLSGLTSSFQAFPITNNEAIGLWNHSSIGTLATVYSNGIATGDELINTGVCQLYGLLRCNYATGTGAYVTVTVRGWNSNTVVAYYNPQSGTWDLTQPAPFYVERSGYKEVKYNLETVNFPAATPTGYDVFIKLDTSGAFVTLDDFHLDSRLDRSSIQDFLIPSGYMIEITPDLGWHNTLDMFSDADGHSNNPHLKTFGIYSIDAGNLEDRLDNTVTATIDESDFLDVVTDRYERYLWRAIPVGDDGSLGPGGIAQKFNYIASSNFAQFSVTSIVDLDNGFIKVINGTKSTNSVILVDGEEPTNIIYPTPDTWKLTLYVTDISRTVKIQSSYNGVLSSAKYVDLNVQAYDQQVRPVWNSFDEHGLLMDIERLPNEDNETYKSRIKDVYRNRGGSNFIGVVNGATRELGLTKILDGLSISINKHLGTNKHLSVLLDSSSTYFRLTYPNLIITETVYVDPVYKTFNLSKDFYDLPIHCEIDNGPEISTDLIERPSDIDEFPNIYRLKINDPRTWGKFIKISYQYYHRFDYSVYSELGALEEAINGLGIITCQISNLLSGNESTLGIYVINILINNDTPVTIPWSPVQLKQISDKHFREFKHDTENYKTSKFYKYVSQLKTNSRTLWGSVEADRDYWDAAGRSDLSFDHLPTLMDPPLAEFFSSGSRVESVQAWARGYTGYNAEIMSNLGLTNNIFQPGVAYNKSLLSTLTLIDDTPDVSIESTNISKQQLDNNQIIFSGQR